MKAKLYTYLTYNHTKNNYLKGKKHIEKCIGNVTSNRVKDVLMTYQRKENETVLDL